MEFSPYNVTTAQVPVIDFPWAFMMLSSTIHYNTFRH